ncbi:cyanate permease [Saccharopolyspora erythraea NRRL 2338]|uniref:Transmembrane transport protein n=2 Tax=Saccharopolyspora erythraea TaxID=1836 RepID=A4FK44_SACEN|nr:MFS transporter [Saccharopolyspora erythraea]EQD86994.1 MFS transporter [Saccharopolyspora erythraea D]PFG98058.1 cyanate permease [Saccharopolyspora erythraea NRRL 2338]QRK88172.1 MFS transporter [Saccharopolyspora erythraea]CAM04419.1 transmembrane transport protein [Saccharopolyspora erythraea NRRL 2338]
MAADRPESRAWWIWGAAVIAYLAAVFHRGSLGVAGPLALDRFDVGPAALSAFTVLQMSIYAGMQIPTGLLADRFGPRRVVTAAVLLLGAGQILFAVADSYSMALLARGVLGVGDALTWVSILRLVATSFSARRYALVATISSALGALGGVAATFPLTLALQGMGWTPTFLLVGALTAGYAAITFGFVRDPRTSSTAGRPSGAAATLARVRAAWAVPGTRLAFWVHFGTLFAAGALTLLWGFPYLVEGLGVAPATASALLSVLIIGQVVGGPVVGALIGRRPECRMPIVVVYLVISALTWAPLLGWPGGTPPLTVVMVAFTVFALGVPVSSIAFALVRDYNPIQQVGTATGVANAGGHSATALGVALVGLVLDGVQGMPAVDGYRIAMLALPAMLVLASWRTFVWWRRARAVVLEAQARGDEVPVSLRRHRWDLPRLTTAASR